MEQVLNSFTYIPIIYDLEHSIVISNLLLSLLECASMAGGFSEKVCAGCMQIICCVNKESHRFFSDVVLLIMHEQHYMGLVYQFWLL